MDTIVWVQVNLVNPCKEPGCLSIPDETLAMGPRSWRRLARKWLCKTFLWLVQTFHCKMNETMRQQSRCIIFVSYVTGMYHQIFGKYHENHQISGSRCDWQKWGRKRDIEAISLYAVNNACYKEMCGIKCNTILCHLLFSYDRATRDMNKPSTSTVHLFFVALNWNYDV